MKVAILQSCYLPWKGYFDIVGSVDVFVVYDDVQYSKNHWHNRNLIKTQHGLKWLTVPVSKAAGAHQAISEVTLPEDFADKHWRSIAQAYASAAHFADYGRRLAALYEQASHIRSLSELNLLFLKSIAADLGIGTRFVSSADLAARGGRTERLVAICRELGAKTYLSGPSAKAYLDTGQFGAEGIAVEWVDYSGYSEYRQLHGLFEHGVSIVDLLLNLGPDEAKGHLKSGNRT